MFYNYTIKIANIQDKENIVNIQDEKRLGVEILEIVAGIQGIFLGAVVPLNPLVHK